MRKGFRIAIASGKGGTGKTTIATNLAKAAADEETAMKYVDCDVEESNPNSAALHVIKGKKRNPATGEGAFNR